MTISKSVAPAPASARKPVHPDAAASTLCRLLLGVCIVLSARAAMADDMRLPTNRREMKWSPAPPVFPKGAQVTVLSGDPFAEGPYVLRLQMPAGYEVPAHNLSSKKPGDALTKPNDSDLIFQDATNE